MPDSNITKKALAMAMKELMEQIPFSKISVSDICEKCGMNRKSFYYHFKDKYDLVNWIFDVEFFQAVHVRDYNLPNWSWRFLEDSCQYFYENQSFYRKALQIEGADLGEQTVEVKFMPPATVSLTEKYAAAAQAKAAGEALETIQENILGYSPEQIAQDKQRRAEEQLALAAGLMGQVQNAAEATVEPVSA